MKFFDKNEIEKFSKKGKKNETFEKIKSHFYWGNKNEV